MTAGQVCLLFLLGFLDSMDESIGGARSLRSFRFADTTKNRAQTKTSLRRIGISLREGTSTVVNPGLQQPRKSESDFTQSLDNYYSRQHLIPKREHRLPILIVGGSDGSGTRAFVDMLGRLGVPILVDDPETLDIHAKVLYHGQGWPPLANRVLNATHSANYKFRELPTDLQTEVLEQMNHFRQQYDVRAARLLQSARETARPLPSAVEYGFKAPISQMLLPLLQKVYGPIKFLHAVRDGRDVALSSNQSPVDKFFDTFYEDSVERRSQLENILPNKNESAKDVMAMQLWNDWNSQVFEWGQKHSDGESFDYLAMRTEDLLDPDKRLDALLQLADFVGSPKSEEEICCLSQRELEDMGASAVGSGGDRQRPDVRESGVFDPKPNPMKRASWKMEPTFGHARLDTDRKDDNVLDAIRKIGKNQASKPQDGTRQKTLEAFEMRMQADSESSDSVRVIEPHRKQFGTESAAGPANDGVVQMIQRLNDKAALQLSQALADTEVKNEEDDQDSMLELNEDERHRRQRREKLVDGISDPAQKEKFRKFLRHLRTSNRAKATPGQVKQRYGKWVSKLKGNPELSDLLHWEGAEGLQIFGYEPAVPFMDHTPRSIDCRPCNT